ncbi:hypothetical protein B0T19DRAFT_437092 [Cercophora scortea]|uniref:Uncharacterized protein n=1 Tax=Cercophora scortea TaxID=314031 RepID=A0AAE0J3L9_9PEZI|nr:hypothetical protein B0T19DRAFT_437092 [Cercophora scortea]
MEYITHSVVNVANFVWIVGTTKDLSVSNMFMMCIFQEGSKRADSNSHYFNISSKDTTSPSQAVTLTATTSSAVSTSSASSTIFSTVSTSSTPNVSSVPAAADATSTSTSAASPATSSGLPTGGAIGIGVGISSAVIIGIGAGWLLFGRHRKRDDTTAVALPMNYTGNTGGYGGQPPPPLARPVELDHVRPELEKRYYYHSAHEVSSESKLAAPRYELQ